MTVTEAPPQDSTEACALDQVTGGLEVILDRLRDAAGDTGGPLALEVRAAKARRAAGELAPLLADLHREAMECDAEAAAIREAGKAAGVLEQAADALRDAEEAYAATAEPERAAAGMATGARQAHERAADASGQARARGASADVLIEADMRVTSAAKVAEHEAGKLAGAQRARQAARAAVDKAREQHRSAQEALAAAEAAAAEPSAANLDASQLVIAWARSWPWNLDPASMTQPELTAFRFLVTEKCDENDWRPRLVEQRVRAQQGREMAAAGRQGRGVTIYDGRGAVTLGRIPARGTVVSPAGGPLSTVGMGR